MKKIFFKAFLLMLAISGSFVLLTSMTNSTTPTPTATNGDIKFTELRDKNIYNRKAVKLTGFKKDEFPHTKQGFLWNESDSKTPRFRPQGITTVNQNNREFVIVSWYGKEKDDYYKKGARISIVDLTLLKTNPSAKNYRHILLVDKNLKPYSDASSKGEKGTMHAGGIAYIDGKLHVADSRKKHRAVRVFDLNKIQQVTPIKKYEYVLVEEYSYMCPVKPSFISYDKDREEMLMGQFHEAPKNPEDATKEKPNLFCWFKAPKNAAEAQAFNASNINIYQIPTKYKKMQGMASMTDPDDATKQILWLSTSFGRANRSNIYKLQVDGASNMLATSSSPSTKVNPIVVNPTETKGKKYPPGLEDANISDIKQLWLLTEFRFGIPGGNYYPLGADVKAGVNKIKVVRRGVFGIDYNQDL